MSGDRYNGAIVLRMPRQSWNNPSINAVRYTEDETYLQNFDQLYDPSKYNDGGAYKFNRKNDHYGKPTHTTFALDRCQDEIAQLVEDQHIAFAEGISAEEKPSIQECMVTWKKIYLNMQDDLDAAKNKIENLMYRNEELRERNLELENILIDSDEETSDSDDTSESLQEQ